MSYGDSRTPITLCVRRSPRVTLDTLRRRLPAVTLRGINHRLAGFDGAVWYPTGTATTFTTALRTTRTRLRSTTSANMNPKLVIAAVVVGVATAGIVGQTFAKAPGLRSHRTPHKPTAHRSMARAEAAADAYSVLARPAVAQDDVSGWNFHAPAALGALRISGARVVYTDSTKMVAAVPTDSGVPCLMTRFAD